MGRFVVDAFGTDVTVECEDIDRQRLLGQWARCVVDRPAPEEPKVTHAGGELVDTCDYALASAVTLRAITEQAGERLMFHACGLADPESGRVAVLVAPSGTGKTTASIRLGRAGLGYVSDETIAVEEDLTVRPYPKPVSVVIDPKQPSVKSQHGPDEMGMATAPSGRLRLGAVVLLHRIREGHTSARLVETELIEALAELLPQTSALPKLAQPLRTLADVICRSGGPVRLEYSEIEEAADLLRKELARRESSSEVFDFEHLPPGTLSSPQTRPIGSGAEPTAVQRSHYLDAIAHDGRVMLLLGTRGVVLDGVGALIWRHAEQPGTVEQFVGLCEEHFGEHPDAEQIVRDAVDSLIEHDVLQPA